MADGSLARSTWRQGPIIGVAELRLVAADARNGVVTGQRLLEEEAAAESNALHRWLICQRSIKWG
jgi:hypothetical protein